MFNHKYNFQADHAKYAKTFVRLITVDNSNSLDPLKEILKERHFPI